MQQRNRGYLVIGILVVALIINSIFLINLTNQETQDINMPQNNDILFKSDNYKTVEMSAIGFLLFSAILILFEFLRKNDSDNNSHIHS